MDISAIKRFLRSWIGKPLNNVLGFVRNSRALQVSACLYLVLSIFQACHQRSSMPTTQVRLLSFQDQPFALCARYPTTLAWDGETRQGIVSLRLLDKNFTTLCTDSTQTANGTATILPPTNLPITATQSVTDTLSAVQATTSSQVMSSNLLIAQSAFITQTNPLTQNSFITQHTVFTTPHLFTFHMSSGLLLVNRESTVYSPTVTLHTLDEISILIAHAQLAEEANIGSLRIKYGTSISSNPEEVMVGLESYADALWKRKLWDILLAPATGALLALLAIGLEELRKRQDRRSIEIQIQCVQYYHKFQTVQTNDTLPLVEEWLSWIEGVRWELKGNIDLYNQFKETGTKAIESFFDFTKGWLLTNESVEPHVNIAQKKLQELIVNDLLLLNELKRKYADLEFVMSYIQGEKSVEDHVFFDNELKDFYEKSMWIRDENRNLETQAINNNKPRYEKVKQDRIEGRNNFETQFINTYLGVPFVRLLWPIKLQKGKDVQKGDANYDFPAQVEMIDDVAFRAIYQIETEVVSAFDICRDYLSLHTHHIVTGTQKAGKTWLRLYLEYFTFMTFTAEEKVLPLFYFAPVTLANQMNVLDIVESLARSVANQLAASLLARSRNHTVTTDPWRVSRIAITPFIQRYGYTLPDSNQSLAEPIPPKQLLDVDLVYGKIYSEAATMPMKHENSVSPVTPQTMFAATTKILDDIQHAVELAGYQYIFVLVDNWENLPSIPRQRLLECLLQPDLQAQFYQRGTFFKLFMPEGGKFTIPNFTERCEIKRLESTSSDQVVELPHNQEDLHNDSYYMLTLYTYRNANAEPESV